VIDPRFIYLALALAAREQPAVAAILVPQPEFNRIPLALLQMPPGCLLDGRQIIGMKLIQESKPLIGELVIAVTDDFLPAWREIILIVENVPIPQAIVHGALRKHVTLLTRKQRFFRLPALLRFPRPASQQTPHDEIKQSAGCQHENATLENLDLIAHIGIGDEQFQQLAGDQNPTAGHEEINQRDFQGLAAGFNLHTGIQLRLKVEIPPPLPVSKTTVVHTNRNSLETQFQPGSRPGISSAPGSIVHAGPQIDVHGQDMVFDPLTGCSLDAVQQLRFGSFRLIAVLEYCESVQKRRVRLLVLLMCRTLVARHALLLKLEMRDRIQVQEIEQFVILRLGGRRPVQQLLQLVDLFNQQPVLSVHQVRSGRELFSPCQHVFVL